MSQPRFHPKIRKARFQVTGYRPEQMLILGDVLQESVEARILRAQDVTDGAAPALKQSLRKDGSPKRGYPFYKQQKGKKPVRDWNLTGRTLRSMRVLITAVNRAVIGFTDAVTNRRAHFNNLRWRQFGVSPTDKQHVAAELRKLDSPITVVRH